MRLHRRAGELALGELELELTRQQAGWTWASLRVLALPAGGSRRLRGDDEELLVLPLAGSCDVACDGERATLTGRDDVFSGPTDFCYVPVGAELVIESEGGGRFALPGARATEQFPFCYRAAGEVEIELRGAGSCSRRVLAYTIADDFPAERLLACEIVTPAGNWSSFPPHKHDEQRDDERELEEIYYYEIAADHSGRRGVAYQRLYGAPGRPIDLLAEVGHGDVVLVPHGYHGPTMALPGYDLYYLNVMAGPGERGWRASDDPSYHWVRSTWQHEEVDARLAGIAGGPASTRGRE